MKQPAPTPKRGRGRPKSAFAFNKSITLDCRQELVDAVEEYRHKHGMRSRSEALRIITLEKMQLDGLMTSAPEENGYERKTPKRHKKRKAKS